MLMLFSVIMSYFCIDYRASRLKASMSELSADPLDDTYSRYEAASNLSPMENDSIPNAASESAPVKYEQKIKWRNVILLTVLHIAGVYGGLASFLNVQLKTWLWCFFVGGVGGFGVTAGAHRLWTHRAYKAKLPLRVILIMCYSVAGHNPLFDWVRDHRVHHQYSETDADPHNAKRGFFFAHVGWLMMEKHPEVKAKGSRIDMSDITRDPIVMFHREHYLAMQLLFCFAIPILTPYLVWGETGFNSVMGCGITRYVVGLNCTWLVNSAAHIWGNKPFNRRIMPAENRVVSLMAMGEGWHNYHHVFPWDYKAAELGNYCLNITTFWIDFFALLGWAYDRRAPVNEMVQRFARVHGDGSYRHHKYHKNLTDQSIEHETSLAFENNNSKIK